MLKDYLEE